MGTNNKPTETTLEHVNFAFKHDQFVVTATYENGSQVSQYFELTDDEFQELDMVVFRERMNRFIGYPLREEPFSFDRELDREGGE